MTMEWVKLLSTHRLKPRKPSSTSTVAGDRRNEFDRDSDRIVYSTPFRRLQDKTQVFPLEPIDFVRTRLTHSLEVSHAAQGLAKDACRALVEQKRLKSIQAGQVETIAATCGLMHDLGNPPFGHSGELAISGWFELEKNKALLQDLAGAHRGDFLHFEGNAQTLRLVTRLQVLADFHGLDLTCGTLSAAIKYTPGSDELAREDQKRHERSKVGFFASERQTVEKIRSETGTGKARNPIAFLVEAADDAAYNTVDLEDGLKKGLLDWASLTSELRLLAPGDACLEECIAWAVGRIEGEVALKGRGKDEAIVQYFRVRAIGQIIMAAAKAFLKHHDAIMEGDYHGELVEDSDAAALVKACRNVNRSRVYCSEETLKLELMGRKMIWDLMDIFWEGAADPDPKKGSFARKAQDLFSANYRRVFEKALEEKQLPEQYGRLQLVTDYVCGMTDTFAAELHRRLMNG